MDIDPTSIDLVRDLAPTLISAVGAILSGLVGIGVFLLKTAWKTNDQRLATISQTLRALSEGIVKESDANHTDHRKLWDSIQGVRVDLEILRRQSEALKTSLMEVSGTTKSQQSTITDLIERLAIVSTELKAVFRYVDASKRATDF